MKRILPIIYLFASSLALVPSAHAAVMVNTIQSATLFDISTYTGAGFEPGATTPGTLDSNDVKVGGVSDGDLDYGDTGTSGDFARGTTVGDVSTGGFYMFDVGQPAFGIQPTSTDFYNSTSYVDILFENNTGRFVNNISVEGQLWYLNNEDRSSGLRFQLSRNGTDFLAIGGIASPADSSIAPSWVSTFVIRDYAFVDSYIAPGEQFTVRVSGFDIGGAGSRDEFAFTGLRVILRNQSLPEPQTMGFLVIGLIGVRYARDRRKKYDYHEDDNEKRFSSIQRKLARQSGKVSLSQDY